MYSCPNWSAKWIIIMVSIREKKFNITLVMTYIPTMNDEKLKVELETRIFKGRKGWEQIRYVSNVRNFWGKFLILAKRLFRNLITDTADTSYTFLHVNKCRKLPSKFQRSRNSPPWCQFSYYIYMYVTDHVPLIVQSTFTYIIYFIISMDIYRCPW